jgi:hypothetical protein
MEHRLDPGIMSCVLALRATNEINKVSTKNAER